MTRTLATMLALMTLVACSRTEPAGEAVPGARLGMSPRDVRDRFSPGTDGSWQTRMGAGDDTVLEWTARSDQAVTQQARFEFHLGMLVAMRVQTRTASRGEQIEATPKTVTVRRPIEAGGGTEIAVLARDCPTHHDEAESLAARAAR